ncbi:MAG: acetyl-CoA C-acyltransferase [Deltaproteobacteria bacterium]|nr:acetyl-CoA C-acyltransferase [Deltaproteobacteria bacterium]
MSTLEPVVVIDGARTPFLRSGTDFADLTAYDLGRMAVAGLLHRTRIAPAAIDLLVMGSVVADPATTNLGREVVVGAGIPVSCPAYTVTVACVSSLQAAIDGVRAIQTGAADVVVAAGAETLSDAPIRFRKPVRQRLIASQKAKGARDWLKLLGGLKPADLLPEAPAIAEFTTGETMGQNCERLARRLAIGRREQDEYAVLSHTRAAKATEAGLLTQIEPAFLPSRKKPIVADNGFRGDTTLEKVAKLSPAFDRKLGTVTAANSSFLTDGAAAVLLMSERKARALRLEPLAVIRSSSVVGMDPREELLLGPAIAMPRALDAAGVALDDVEVVELHEAFAAQVLAVRKMLADGPFCRDRLGKDRPVGLIDTGRLNLWGGSLSLGHPFGATGARLILNAVHRMRHEKARRGIVAACAAGAIGIAMVLERP